MTTKAKKEESFVTQSQWAEGMEMIKGFFEKLYFEIKDFREEQRQTNNEMQTDITEMKQNIEMNTQAIHLVSKQQQETQKIEHDIFNHEQRITKLEKVK